MFVRIREDRQPSKGLGVGPIAKRYGWAGFWADLCNIGPIQERDAVLSFLVYSSHWADWAGARAGRDKALAQLK